MKFIKRLTAILITLTVITSIIPASARQSLLNTVPSASGFLPVNAEAAAKEMTPTNTGFDVYIDSAGDVCVVTNDKRRTSSIYYRTVGFTISRGQFKPYAAKVLAKGKATEYFYVSLGDMTVETHQQGSREINTFKLGYDELKSRIAAASGEWREEIEQAEKFGGTAFVRFDCDMVIFHGSTQMPSHYLNHPPIDGTNPAAIQAAEPWSAGGNTGLRTHYNRWLPISSQLPLIQTPIWTDHHVTQQNPPPGAPGPGPASGGTLSYCGDYSGDPAFAGGNANLDGYNASEGVPSTSTITGYSEASPWYGCIDVWTRMVTKQFKITYRYKWCPDDLPSKETYEGEDSLDDAVDKLNEAMADDKKTTEPLLEDDAHQKPDHDTLIDKVYHHYIKVYWTDWAGEDVLGTSETGKEDPKSPKDDSTHTPKRPKRNPDQWLHGFDYYMPPPPPPPGGGGGSSSPTVYHFENDSEAVVKDKMEALEDAGYVICDEEYEDTVPLKTDFKLTCIVDRDFWDDEYNAANDKFMQMYVAFEYIDPWKTLFFDLDYVTLFNDVYEAGSLGFPQVIPTDMAALKSKDATSQMSFSEWFKEHEHATAIDSSLILTSDYLKWCDIKDGVHQKGKIQKKYKEDIEDLQAKIYKETSTQNDYVKCKNPIDLFAQTGALGGPDDGKYLGNEGAIGIVYGCDFRDAYWAKAKGFVKAGTDSIGKITELSGLENVNSGTMTGSPGKDLSKYFYLCVNSSACDKVCDKDDANGYYIDNLAKAAGANQVFEKLGGITSPIEVTIKNGRHPTDISTTYSPVIVGPATTTQQFSSVLAGHLYSDTIGDSGSTLNFSKWGGKMGSSEGPMNADGSPGAPLPYEESVNR